MKVRVARRLGFQCITKSVVHDSESMHPKPSRLGTAAAGALVHTSSVFRGSVQKVLGTSVLHPLNHLLGCLEELLQDKLTGIAGRSASCGLEAMLEPEPKTLSLCLSGNFQAKLEKLK